MRCARVLTAIVILLAGAASNAAAQMIVYDNTGARVSLRAGYGGHGPDWDASIDSPLFADAIRIRGGVGRGPWVSPFDSHPPAGNDPTVTRIAASGILFLSPPEIRSGIRPYVGIGIAAYVPRGVDMNAQRGVRLIAGMEGSGERWTVALEVEGDLPRPNDDPRPRAGDDLLPAARLGIALRRRF